MKKISCPLQKLYPVIFNLEHKRIEHVQIHCKIKIFLTGVSYT